MTTKENNNIKVRKAYKHDEKKIRAQNQPRVPREISFDRKKMPSFKYERTNKNAEKRTRSSKQHTTIAK